MTNPYIGTTHFFWLEQLYKQQEKRRTNSAIPTTVFKELKALGCVEGEPGRAAITPHGSGMFLTIRNEQAAAEKKEKTKKRSKRK